MLEAIPLPLDGDWLPDLNAITPELGARLKLLWLNFPNNPTGKGPLGYYRDALDLADRYFYVASGRSLQRAVVRPPAARAPAGAAPRGYHRAVVFNTLSKRSNMTAYRRASSPAIPSSSG